MKNLMMRAVVLEKVSTAHELTVTEVPVPQIKPGWVLVKIKAFGINRSELFTRKGQSPSVKLPRIIGIECVGEIADPSDSNLEVGQCVISMMGGLGRVFDGSYAEYALIPTKQIYPVHSNLAWAEFGAIPEMYYTSWCSLIDTLKLKTGETLLIRGGTSSIGLASIQIARQMGVTVIATTRTIKKVALLEHYGANTVLIDDDTLLEQANTHNPYGADKILELVGATTLQSSFQLLKPGGTLCMTGILGGQWDLKHFAPMDFIPSGSYFTIYDSQFVDRNSLSAMFNFINDKNIKPAIDSVFEFDNITDAHLLMESNCANGKIVVIIDSKDGDI